MSTPPPRSPLSNLLAGALGGLVVLIAGAALMATGVIDTGDDTREVVRQQPIARPAADNPDDARTVSDIYKEEGKGVVFIEARGVTDQQESPFGLPQERGTATGSGFVVDEEGTILTNSHVVEGAQGVTVSFREDRSDSVEARVAGRDPSTDLAVLKVDADEVKDLKPLPLGSSKSAEVGDPLVAIGNPFGFTRTVTTGIVSGVQRRIDAPNEFTIANAIQTDASINPGNSGGPLLDAQGRVIGINAQIATGGSQGSVGVGFAIPIDTAKKLLPKLENGEDIQRGFLGVEMRGVDDAIARDLNLPVKRGALIQRVTPSGPADKAGLRAGRTETIERTVVGGDVIVGVDGEDVKSPDDVARIIEAKRPGDEVEIEFFRRDDRKKVTAKLAKRPKKANLGSEQPPGGGGILPPP
jgi:S1-C subfamily serine protease